MNFNLLTVHFESFQESCPFEIRKTKIQEQSYVCFLFFKIIFENLILLLTFKKYPFFFLTVLFLYFLYFLKQSIKLFFFIFLKT